MRLFNRDFLHIDEDSQRGLLSVDRERAIYADMWIDDIQDFRHVRIDLTEAEVSAYVDSLWSYELFLAAGSPKGARGVPGIPPEISLRADNYVIFTTNGKQLGPPYHCAAAFLGPVLEELICFPPTSRRAILEEQGAAALLTTIKRVMDSLVPSMRLFNHRASVITSKPAIHNHFKTGQRDRRPGLDGFYASDSVLSIPV